MHVLLPEFSLSPVHSMQLSPAVESDLHSPRAAAPLQCEECVAAAWTQQLHVPIGRHACGEWFPLSLFLDFLEAVLIDLFPFQLYVNPLVNLIKRRAD